MEMAGDCGIDVIRQRRVAEFRWTGADGARPSRDGNGRQEDTTGVKLAAKRDEGAISFRGGRDREFTSSYINAVTSACVWQADIRAAAASTSGAWFRRSICMGTHHSDSVEETKKKKKKEKERDNKRLRNKRVVRQR